MDSADLFLGSDKLYVGSEEGLVLGSLKITCNGSKQTCQTRDKGAFNNLFVFAVFAVAAFMPTHGAMAFVNLNKEASSSQQAITAFVNKDVGKLDNKGKNDSNTVGRHDVPDDMRKVGFHELLLTPAKRRRIFSKLSLPDDWGSRNAYRIPCGNKFLWLKSLSTSMRVYQSWISFLKHSYAIVWQGAPSASSVVLPVCSTLASRRAPAFKCDAIRRPTGEARAHELFVLRPAMLPLFIALSLSVEIKARQSGKCCSLHECEARQSGKS